MYFFQGQVLKDDFKTRILQLTIILTLLFSVFIIALIPPATGYELSIYEAYPSLLWGFIAINIFSCVYSIIRSCDSQYKNSYYGYFSILLIETLILLLPIIRGYYAMSRGGGDIYHHIFVATQISNTGFVPITDTYPMMHVWLSILHHFLPDFIVLAVLLSIVFFYLYISSLFILGKTIISTFTGGVFISIFGIPLIFSYGHYAFFPFLFALILVPLILYTYQKILSFTIQKNRFYICLVCLSLFIVFCHPLITIFLTLMFSSFAIYILIKRWNTAFQLSTIVTLNIVTIMFITFILWLFQFRSLLHSLKKIISTLSGQGSYISIIDYQLNSVITSNASIWLIIDRFIKIYGPICLYFLIAFLFLSYIIIQYYRNRRIYEIEFIYSMQFCVAICIGIALFIGYFIIFEPIRASMYGLIFATILCGFCFYRFWCSIVTDKQKQHCITTIVSIITVVCMLTMFNIYASPWISGTNTALTYGDKKGFDWILEFRNADIPIVKNDESMGPYASYYYESKNENDFQRLIEYTWKIPSDFGYNETRMIGASFGYLPDNEVYMITTELLKLTPYAVPVERRALLPSFSDSDFTRLKNDPSVNLIYSGNKFGVWNIEIL